MNAYEGRITFQFPVEAKSRGEVMAAKKASKKAKKKASKKVTAKKRVPAKTKKASVKKTATKGSKSVVSSAEDSMVGRTLPSFSLESTSGSQISVKDLAGKVAVLYFYPKDNTPGCTLEGHDFRRLYKEFQKAGAEIYGVSRDSIKSHHKFADSCGFPFQLLSDPEDKLMRPLGVIGMKQLYGREYEGIIRSTFLIDSSGKIRKVWRNLKVKGHADAVLEAAKTL